MALSGKCCLLLSVLLQDIQQENGHSKGVGRLRFLRAKGEM